MALDSDLNEECMLFLNILYDSADNPMVSECASHLGLNANKFCPRCKVGGDKKYKASDEGYHSLFDVCTYFYLIPFLLVHAYFTVSA